MNEDDLLKAADAKLEQNEIELLGCYDVHPEPYENNPEAAEARRAFLDHLLAPFFARIRELEAQCFRLTEERDRAIEWRDHDKTRAETAEAALEYIMDGYGLNAPDFRQTETDEDGNPLPDDWIVAAIRAALTAPSAKPKE
jgi:hypothetical protein